MAPASSPIRVGTVDDHPLIREGMSAREFRPFGAANRISLWLPKPQMAVKPSSVSAAIVPISLSSTCQMPEINGVDRDHRDPPCVSRSSYHRSELTRVNVQALRSMKAGASGYMLKSMVRKELLDTIRAVPRRSGAGFLRKLPQNDRDVNAGDLTERELPVLREVSAGNANKDIAARLAVSEETVRPI